jgi:small subunit ribosomal protein S2
MVEKQQAEADKEIEEVAVAEVADAGAELKPGERKVISDGSDGPVVEIIRKTTKEAEHDSETLENSESQDLEKTSEAEITGEEDGDN